MRNFSFIATLLLAVAGCSRPVPFCEPSGLASEISFRKSTSEQDPKKQGGLFTVDGHAVPPSPTGPVHVVPGVHELGFLCPGWFYVDGYASVRYELVAGVQYEMFCSSGDVQIERIDSRKKTATEQ